MCVRTVLLVNTMTPFRAACYAALSRQPDIELDVWITGGKALIRPEMLAQLPGLPFHCELLPAKAIKRGPDSFTIINPDLLFRLEAARPQVVVSSELSLPSYWAALYARLRRCRLVLWGGGTQNSERGISRLKRIWRRWLTRQANGYLAYGTASARYWRSLGAPAGRITVAYNTVDVHRWQTQAAQARQTRNDLRQQLGVREFGVLYVGQLIPRKQSQLLVELAELCERQQMPIDFILAGDGSERDALLRSIAMKGLSNVRVMPFQPPEKLVHYYVAADAFALPSSDIWGLVVNEAMACGLPPLVHPWVESAEDLIVDGENGFVVDFKNPAAVARILGSALSDRARWRAIGLAAADTIMKFTPELWAERASHAIGDYPSPQSHTAAQASARDGIFE
jgi:glycosyltransferase involved in cell wall biosynthesis